MKVTNHETGSNLTEKTLFFCGELREAEERFASAAMHYPSNAVESAKRCGLTRQAFIYDDARFCFQVAHAAAECGAKLVTLDQLRELSRINGNPIALNEWQLARFYWAECTPTGLDVWAADIVEAHRRRVRAQALIAEAERELGGVESVGSIAERMARDHRRKCQRVTLPKRKPKRPSVRSGRRAVAHV